MKEGNPEPWLEILLFYGFSVSKVAYQATRDVIIHYPIIQMFLLADRHTTVSHLVHPLFRSLPPLRNEIHVHMADSAHLCRRPGNVRVLLETTQVPLPIPHHHSRSTVGVHADGNHYHYILVVQF